MICKSDQKNLTKYKFLSLTRLTWENHRVLRHVVVWTFELKILKLEHINLENTLIASDIFLEVNKQ